MMPPKINSEIKALRWLKKNSKKESLIKVSDNSPAYSDFNLMLNNLVRNNEVRVQIHPNEICYYAELLSDGFKRIAEANRAIEFRIFNIVLVILAAIAAYTGVVAIAK
jgi:hypothetical protein